VRIVRIARIARIVRERTGIGSSIIVCFVVLAGFSDESEADPESELEI